MAFALIEVTYTCGCKFNLRRKKTLHGEMKPGTDNVCGSKYQNICVRVQVLTSPAAQFSRLLVEGVLIGWGGQQVKSPHKREQR